MNNYKMKHLFKIVITNQTSDSMKCTGDCQPYPSKLRNFPLENYCPNTPDSSPRRTSQSKFADAFKVYAKK